MTEGFNVERTIEGFPLDRGNVESVTLVSVPGLCMADPAYPIRPRDIEWYKSTVLGPLIEQNLVSDGSDSQYDDRKMRFHSASAGAGTLELAFGMTTFQEYKATIGRAPAENERLRQAGLEMLNEEYAFFSRAPGVTGLVISSDKSVFIGGRTGTDEYVGALNGVSGHLGYRENVEQVNLEEDIDRELLEELGITPEQIQRRQFVGIFTNPLTGEADFTFLINTDRSDDYFLSGEWKKKATGNVEHTDLVQIPSYGDVRMLLRDGTLGDPDDKRDIMYPTRGALMSLRPDEIGN